MALTAFFDESGTHGKDSPAVVVGGFVATEANWAAYEKDLQNLLGSFGVGVFHAKPYRDRSGSFRGWSDRRFRDFGTRFFQLYDWHLGRGIAVAISPEDYDEIYRGSKFPEKGRQDSQYGLCFRFCLLALIDYAKDLEHEWPINIIMESGHRNAGDAVRIFDEVKSTHLKPKYQHLLGAIAFGSKATCPPLASADAMVHTLFRSKANPAGWQKALSKSAGYIRSAAGWRASPPRSRIQLHTANKTTLSDLRKHLDEGQIVTRLVPFGASEE